jgi:hypothetical protein
MSFVAQDGTRTEAPVAMTERRQRTLTPDQIVWYRDMLCAFLYHGSRLTPEEIVEILLRELRADRLR